VIVEAFVSGVPRRGAGGSLTREKATKQSRKMKPKGGGYQCWCSDLAFADRLFVFWAREGTDRRSCEDRRGVVAERPPRRLRPCAPTGKLPLALIDSSAWPIRGLFLGLHRRRRAAPRVKSWESSTRRKRFKGLLGSIRESYIFSRPSLSRRRLQFRRRLYHRVYHQHQLKELPRQLLQRRLLLQAGSIGNEGQTLERTLESASAHVSSPGSRCVS